MVDEIAADHGAAQLRPFVAALKAIVAGSRDRALADTEGVDYKMAAEILLLIERLVAAS